MSTQTQTSTAADRHAKGMMLRIAAFLCLSVATMATGNQVFAVIAVLGILVDLAVYGVKRSRERG